MYCPNCGVAVNEVDVQFCEFCGTELSFKREINRSESEKTFKLQTRRRHCC